MNNIDEKLKNKAKDESVKTPIVYDKKIEELLKTLPKKKIKKKYPRVGVIAVVITTIATASVIAGPYVVELTGGAINYFKDSKNPKDLKYISDKEILEQYNGQVVGADNDKGITFTIDNIAVDDNFLNIFYTIKGEKDLDHYSKYIHAPALEYEINGERVQTNNIYHTDSYFESNNELKVMERLSIAQVEAPEAFELKICTEEIFEEKGNWEISLNIDKKEAIKDTSLVKANIKASVSQGDRVHDIEIEKIIMSPLGNQIIISQKSDGLRSVFSSFALQDDKGEFIDVYPGIVAYGGPNGIAKNSFEFANISDKARHIRLIPIVEDKAHISKTVSADISNDNIRLKLSEVGAIVIKNIDINEKRIVVDYKTEGAVPFIGGFVLLNKNNKPIDLGGLLEEKFDRQTGIQTITKTFSNSTPEKISQIKKIGMYNQPFKLNYDEQIEIPLVGVELPYHL